VYARSVNRLDDAVVSKSLLADINEADLMHYHEFYPSDHRPIHLGIHSTFFGALRTLVAHQFRYINGNSKLVGDFVTLAYQHLIGTGTFQRMTGVAELITHVEVIDIRAELEACILERNKGHFAQAQGTPFTEPPYSS
jgi:hypothetical protein